ncbi:MAG: dihydropteroate synthase [Arsenophonus endosymbiont of Ceratovacuna japonica]
MKIVTKKINLDLNHPIIMGILNITPDSFYDGGIYNNYNYALQHTSNMIKYGATIIDIGGESTRPGANKVSLQQELDRVIPIIEAIVNRFNILISIDTSKAVVMEEAAKAGVHIINDIRSLHEPNALETAAKTGLLICIMHILNQSKIKHQMYNCKNIVIEIKQYLLYEINRCKKAGITKNRLIIDPGFGFGKNVSYNYKLLSKLNELHSLGLPILVGISRKSMIGILLNLPLKERLIGSIVCAVIAIMKGACIIRTHDVKETAQAIKIIKETFLEKEKNYYE